MFRAWLQRHDMFYILDPAPPSNSRKMLSLLNLLREKAPEISN